MALSRTLYLGKCGASILRSCRIFSINSIMDHICLLQYLCLVWFKLHAALAWQVLLDRFGNYLAQRGQLQFQAASVDAQEWSIK